ncbi:acyl-CoA dehydrogenase family protein [Pseudonocardia sp. NPDC049154]|uniref:acyl-CoA dehydrogenase family protein n=1 Tax=Pseudonocardia sp. NPDC049154 TaxID=3155501 RepID=UPI003400557E
MSDTRLAIDPDPEKFRADLRGWLAEHLTGEFAEHLGIGSTDDAEGWDIRVRWEKVVAAAGLQGITWPEAWGGRGASAEHDMVLTTELARARAPYRAGVHGMELFGPTLAMFGTEEQKQRFLPRICAVEEFWGQGFSEPEAGSDLASLRTRARLEGDEWVLDGQKIWMTFGMYADWFYVLCRTDPEAKRHKGLSLIMVPRDQPGIDVRPIRNMAGAAEFCEVFFDGARTAKENVVGPVDEGWRVAMGALAVERGSVLMPVQLGYEREIQATLELARERRLPAGLRDRLVDSWIAVRLMRATTERTLGELAAGEQPGPQSTTAKLFQAVEHQKLLERATEAMADDVTATGPDYELDPVQRAYLLSRAETIYGGTAQVQRNIIAERLLGMPREPRPV